jgi:hypothetical protein
MKIGPYELSQMTVPEGESAPYHEESHIYIRHESGEAMSVREEILAEVIDRFYKEHF